MDFIIDAYNFGENVTPESWNEFETFIATLRESRYTGVPDTLQHLAVGCIAKNRARFISHKPATFVDFEENIFSYMPNMVVQELVRAVIQDTSGKKRDVSKFCFLLQLLNKRVTEFRFSHLDLSNLHPSGEAAVFNHLLHHCPKMEKIELTNDVWGNYAVVPRLRLDHIFPMMASKWPNLNYISVSSLISGYTCEISILQGICDNFPTLRGLEIPVRLNRPYYGPKRPTGGERELSVEDIKKLSKMQHLKVLTLNVTDWSCLSDFDKPIKKLVKAVGVVPNLETLDLHLEEKSQYRDYVNSTRMKTYSSFVHFYKEKFPHKKLFMKQIEVHTVMLDNDWPECLSVEELQVFGFEGPSCNFSALRHKLHRLVFNKCTPAQVYTLVEQLGAGLTHFTISSLLNGTTPLELNRIMDVCPELEVIDINSSARIEVGPLRSSVKPEHFKKCFKFNVVSTSIEQPEKDIEHLYKMFLLGSEQKLKEFVVSSKGALNASAWALQQEQHTCIDQLKSIRVDLPKLSKDILRETIKFILGLAQRSRYLREVEIINPDQPNFQATRPLRWFGQILQGAGILCPGKWMQEEPQNPYHRRYEHIPHDSEEESDSLSD